MHQLWWWFLHYTGSSNPSGPWYGFWSGFGSDLGEFGIILVIAKHLNCHVRGCPRIGWHHLPGTVFKVCKKHHPKGGNSVEDIHSAYEGAK